MSKTTTRESKMTDKQRSYIESLIHRQYGSRYITAQIRRDHHLTQREARWDMTKAEASALIASLLGN